MSRRLDIRWIFVCFAVFPAILFSGVARAAQPVNVAVLNMEGQGIDTQLLSTLTSVLRNEAQQDPRYSVVNQTPINLSEILVSLGCNTVGATCLNQAAKQLAARVLIYGRIQKVTTGYSVIVEVFDARKFRVTHRMVRLLSSGDDPVVAFRRDVDVFFAAQRAPKPTDLQIGANVIGAQIKIDNIIVGNAPFERKGLPPGRYHVEISHPGYLPWRAVVELSAGANVHLWAPLTASPATPKPAPKPHPEATVAPSHPQHATAPHGTPKRPQKSSAFISPAAQASANDNATGHEAAVRWGAWSAIGVGGVALAGSVAMALLMKNVENQIRDANARGTLTERQYNDMVNQGKSYELSHRVLLGLGGASMTAGILWLLLSGPSSSPHHADHHKVSLRFTGDGISALCRW